MNGLNEGGEMFSILSRRESGSEKCPKCSRVAVDFVNIQEDILGCFDCGCLFMTKVGRVKVRVLGGKAVVVAVPGVVEAKVEDRVSEETVAPPVGYTCGECGKGLKTKLALAGHMRSHK